MDSREDHRKQAKQDPKDTSFSSWMHMFYNRNTFAIANENDASQPPVKRGRGRPPSTRRSGGDSRRGDNANSSEPPVKCGRGRLCGLGRSGGDSIEEANVNSSGPLVKRGRGKNQLKALEGVTNGPGFMPHVITVETGEDIIMKLLKFSQEAQRSIRILSATGDVSCARFHDGTHKGPFEIVTLTGSVTNCEIDNGSLSVLLAKPDDQIIGGSVAGMLIAESRVKINYSQSL